MNHRKVTCIALISFIVACSPSEKAKESMALSSAVSRELERQYGQPPKVLASYGPQDELRSVTVTFKDTNLQAPKADISRKARELVISEFRQTPPQVNVVFVSTE
jgi:hypothetical protein